MSVARLLLFAFIFGALCQAQPASPVQKRSKEIQSLVGRALIAPPELGADVLIRLVESKNITDRDWKIEVLEQAFHLAGRAKHPVKVIGTVPAAGNTDSDIGVLNMALNFKLDGLTLQCRAVREMLALDPKQARELFLEIPALRLPALSCDDPIGYRPGEYYATLKEIAERGFTEKEKREGKALALLEDRIRSISSPFQLYPALKLIVDFKGLRTDQLASLVVAYGSGMKQLNSEDRTFSGSTGFDLVQELLGLARLCRERGIPAYPLIDAFRSYFVRHMAGVRCAENADPENHGLILSRIRESFNQNLQPLSVDVPEIKPDEVKPASVGNAAKVYAYWRRPQSKELLENLRRLRFGTEEQQAANNQKPAREDGGAQFLTDDQRREPEWEAKALEYLNQLESWKNDNDETAANYFHQMCFMYAPLVELIPAGPVRDRVLRSYILFLRRSPIESDSPPEWFLELERLINLREANEVERAHIRDEIRESGDDLMNLYVEVSALEVRAKKQ